eukprot:jgi/Chlat1/6374/Chrsp44S05832
MLALGLRCAKPALVLRHRSIRSLTMAAAGPVAASVAGEKRKVSKVIGTHDGAFHCDEAMGCYMLRLTNAFRDADVIRTRDEQMLATCDAVLDVGGLYDPSHNRFDHHQREFTGVFGFGSDIKLSSAGLVYKHFGKEIIASLLGLTADHPDTHTAIDAVDNGVNPYDTNEPPKYTNNTTLGARVGHLNPSWNEDQSPEARYARFLKAMALTGAEFEDAVNYYGKGWLPARAFVEAALKERSAVDASGEIIVLQTSAPWKEHLYQVEEELQQQGAIKYCLYEDDKKNWRVQAVPVTAGDFRSRKPLPTAWRGLRDNQLSETAGIPDCIFVHASGFIGGNKTYEGALQMAKKALTLD